jgi:membrane associated rhomboid family serine protease
MIPIQDVIPARTKPWITIVVVFLAMRTQSQPADIVTAYGVVPAEFSWSTLVPSLFLHNGWLHVASNLVALWIFGGNVEDRMGHARFLMFYLIAGASGALGQTWMSPQSAAPLVGASGAIAGVIGAYFVLFPQSRVLVLLVLLVFVDVVEVPALFFVGAWFLFQVLSGVAETATGEVGFWSLLGGLVAGIIAVWLFRRRERLTVAWWSG